jgi:hypothetical protein
VRCPRPCSRHPHDGGQGTSTFTHLLT